MPTAVLFDVSILYQPPSSAHMHVQNFWKVQAHHYYHAIYL